MNKNKYSIHLFKPLKVDCCLFNPNFVSVAEYEVTILIIWSQYFHFNYLWNLLTAHH